MATEVASFSELKTLVEDSVTTDILVAQDITFSSGGININVSKPSLVIDFGGHKVTDYTSSTFTDTLHVSSTTNTISVTVKNAEWSGRNYYGVVGVYNGNTNTTVTLQNISYTGPQFMYNKNGVTNIIDCTIILSSNGTSTNPQECLEANRVSVSGNVQVTSNSTSDAVIWFTGQNASLTVQENATFIVKAELTYLLYTDSSPDILCKKNSSTTITTQRGLFYASGSGSHIAKSFTLEEGASFVAYKNASNSVPMFKCQSNFTINKNSTFRLFSEMISSTALVYFGQAANIQINSPKNVVLYNRGGDIFSFQTGTAANPNTINMSTEMLRLWDVAKSPITDAGTFDNPPSSEFYKANYANDLTLNIKSTTSQMTELTSNLEEGDNGYPFSSTSLKLFTSKVISLGSLPLDIATINDLSTEITGTTEPLANIGVALNGTQITTADSEGDFIVAIDPPAVDTPVTIAANINFLTKEITTQTEGSVSVSHVDDLKFKTFTTKSNMSIILRDNTDFTIEIKDTRTSGGNWTLYCFFEQPLTSGDNKLENNLVFNTNDASNIISTTLFQVHSGTWNATQQTTTLTWDKLQGFLLSLAPQAEYPAGTYTTTLHWEIVY